MAAQGLQFTEIVGDVFTRDPHDSMATCVSNEFKMSKSLAKQFKDTFKGVDELKAQNKSTGEVAVLYRNGTYIYHLITKERVFHRPSTDTLRSCLVAMRDHCRQNNVTSLAMPRIGCGLDRLNWSEVSEIIKDVFKNTGMTIKIYRL
ncbi:ADP-ribose glycohydrolase OARD1-like isoform X1 [Littorina saxatilis]|uniref:Macro domain-containing protein n=1 Tax=Littorina saxatilis TaxID=31220 RepID=A0AAN9GHM5_9CAEN